jgi:hypothetical protein
VQRAKGATLVNYLDLGDGFFEFAADANPRAHLQRYG